VRARGVPAEHQIHAAEGKRERAVLSDSLIVVDQGRVPEAPPVELLPVEEGLQRWKRSGPDRDASHCPDRAIPSQHFKNPDPERVGQVSDVCRVTFDLEVALGRLPGQVQHRRSKTDGVSRFVYAPEDDQPGPSAVAEALG
jgi:hypothetical protein